MMNTPSIRFAFLTVLAAYAALPLSATTYYVAPNGSDLGAGTSSDPFKSLSAALARADVTEVRLAEGEYADMATMTSTLSGSTGTDWLGVVTTGVKIVGAGEDKTILHCVNSANAARGGIVLNHDEAELAGVTITGAFYENWNAQGIAVRILKGTMRSCTLTGNSVPGNKVKNNTILSLESATAAAYDSKIVDNDLGTNSRAAAVTMSGSSRMERCTIARNRSGDYASVNGLSMSSATAVDCEIYENSGYNTGIAAGGVSVGGTSQLIGCVVSNNVNTSRYQSNMTTSSAGGVYVNGANSVISNCTIVGNANYSSCGVNAGGLYIGASGVKVYDSEVSDNFSANGAELIMNANAMMTNSVVRNVRGAPLVDRKSGQFLECVFDYGSALSDDRPAICYVSTTGSATAPYDTAEKATPDLQAAVDAVRRGGRVIVAAGTYDNTSALVERKYNVKHSLFVDKDVSIEGPDDPAEAVFLVEHTSTVKTQGGGFWLAHPQARLAGVTLTVLARPADTYQYCGQGLQLDGGVVSNCVVTGCAELASVGSHSMTPVVIDGGRMTHSSIRDNAHRSGYWGRGSAGLVVDAGSFEHGHVLRNGFPTANADQAEANGILIRGGSVTDTIVEGNYGGANRADTASGVKITGGTLARCIVQCNTNNAGTAGSQVRHAGGVYVSGAASVENCLIAGNRAVTTAAASAGGLYVNDGKSTIRHVTLTANVSAAGEGGAYLANGSVMKASIAFGNEGSQVCCGNGTADVWTTKVDFGNCNEPLPVDWETAASYAVTSSSEGYNAVKENYVGTDMLGVVRPVVGEGSTDFPDAGAMEKVGPPPGEIIASVMPASAFIPLDGEQAFSVALDGEDTTVASCVWTVEFEGETTTETAYSAAYVFSAEKPGVYTLTVAASNGSGKTAPSRSVKVTVAPLVCHVAPDGGNVYPYDTPAKAATAIGPAIAAVYGVDGRPGTVLVAAGEYVNPPETAAANGYTYVAALEKAVRLIAPEGPAKTKIRYASTDLGGCFFLGHPEAEASGFTLTGSTKVDNDSRWSSFGNAISLTSGTVSNCVMTGCTVTGSHIIPTLLVAGGLAKDCAVTNNNLGTAWGRGALGVVVSGGTLADSLVAGNNQTAKNYDLLQAGGVYISGGTVTGCRIEGNYGARNQVSAGGFAAGVVMAGGTLDHTLVAGNIDCSLNAATYSGGGLLVNSASAIADHVTVADNVSSNAACGKVAVYVRQGTLKNAIVWDNDAADLNQAGGTVSYCCWPLATGEGNIASDPGLRRNLRQPYCINSVSPCSHTGEARTYMGWCAPFAAGLSIVIR